MRKEFDNMIVIGGSHRQSGKTDVACHIIKKLMKSGPVICLKVCCHDINDSRDTKADFMLDDYWMVKEEPQEGTKSTDKMYAAGARAVYRLIVMRETLEEGFNLFLEAIGDKQMVVCESNSIIDIIKPASFIFISKQSEEKEKNSSSRVRKFADIIVENDGEKFKPALDKIKLPDIKGNIKKKNA
ncbi:MAG: hypothetical protein KGZ97_06015 [Bacteroidetes bacterium]|nr:hypothetical protein [Bacteroidota bacterium]